MSRHSKDEALELMDDAVDNLGSALNWERLSGVLLFAEGVGAATGLITETRWVFVSAFIFVGLMSAGIIWMQLYRVGPLTKAANDQVKESIALVDDYDRYSINMPSSIVPSLYEVPQEDVHMFEQALLDNPETAARIDAFLNDPSTGVRRERPAKRTSES